MRYRPDKVDTEVESPVEGILISYTASVDEEVPVGNPIAKFAPLDTDTASVAEAIAQASGAAIAPHVAPTPAASSHSPANTASAVQPAAAVVHESHVPPPNDSLILAASWIDPIAPPPGGRRRGGPTTTTATAPPVAASASGR